MGSCSSFLTPETLSVTGYISRFALTDSWLNVHLIQQSHNGSLTELSAQLANERSEFTFRTDTLSAPVSALSQGEFWFI